MQNFNSPQFANSEFEKESPRFPIGKCKRCGKEVKDDIRDGKTIYFCSYECYCLD